MWQRVQDCWLHVSVWEDRGLQKTINKKDWPHKHKVFLEALNGWVRQHKENPSRVELKNKHSSMEVQKQLTTARTHRGEFQAPEMTFVLVEDWDEKGDGKYDPSKVTDAFVHGGTRKGIWKITGKNAIINIYSPTALR